MDIFSVFTLFGGLALFLFGMNQMSQSLEKLAGSKMETILNRLTDNRMKGLALGFGITAVIQSSSAVTVMLVGLVNSGILNISNTVGVIMGSNIGTTVTAWLMSLIGISGENFFVRILTPSAFSPILAFIGIILIMAGRTSKKRDIGGILMGFAILMFAMQTMSGAMIPLADSPKFMTLMTVFKNPILGVLVGLAITAVIQSSSASVGMLQALSLTGHVTYAVAIPIIMGQNIGTCVTAIISSIGVNKNAKRVAFIHILFNIIGTTVFLFIFYGLSSFITFSFMNDAAGPVEIAIFHSIFNITTTAILLPFSKQLVNIALKTIKVEPVRQIAFLDDRLLKTPSFALHECRNMIVEMAHLSKGAMLTAMQQVFNYNETAAERVRQIESDTDVYEDQLGSYLVKLSAAELSDADIREISLMLHTIGNFERIADHSLNVLDAGKELMDKDCKLSDEAKTEISVITEALSEILEKTMEAFEKKDLKMASGIEPLEEVIDELIEQARLNHVARLQCGSCTIKNGFVFQDIITNYERVSDHCSNIAVAMLETNEGAFEVHEYMTNVRSMENSDFRSMFAMYAKRYRIKGSDDRKLSTMK